MDGKFPRLNGAMVKGGEGTDGIISVIGEMKSCDGEQLVLAAADGEQLTYNVQPDFVFESGKVVEIMGTLDADSGMLQAFVTRELGSDFDLALYNDLITQVIGSGKHSSYFG